MDILHDIVPYLGGSVVSEDGQCHHPLAELSLQSDSILSGYTVLCLVMIGAN